VAAPAGGHAFVGVQGGVHRRQSGLLGSEQQRMMEEVCCVRLVHVCGCL
jgi:hypothetical protein